MFEKQITGEDIKEAKKEARRQPELSPRKRATYFIILAVLIVIIFGVIFIFQYIQNRKIQVNTPVRNINTNSAEPIRLY